MNPCFAITTPGTIKNRLIVRNRFGLHPTSGMQTPLIILKPAKIILATGGVLAWCFIAVAGELHDKALIDPKADALLLRYIEAQGGKAALEAITAQRLTGTIERHGNKVPHIRTQKGPNLLLTETRFPRPGTLKQGFNGTKGWVQHPLQGGRLMEGKELEGFAAQAWLEPTLHLNEMFSERKWLGPQTVEGTKLTALSLAKKKGTKAETWFFDDATALLSQVEQTIDGGPQGRIPVRTRFSVYRTVNGIMVPFTITTQLGEGTSNVTVFRIDSVEHNFKIDDAIFQPPF